MSFSTEPKTDQHLDLWTQVRVAGVELSAPAAAHTMAGRDRRSGAVTKGQPRVWLALATPLG